MARRGGIEPPSSIQLLYYQLRRLVLGHSAPEKLNRVNVLDNCIMSAVYKVFAGSLLKIAYSN